ncbi:GD17513 [Drosophila simulans]|uniref:GD17513 n=1 Tax=Drosophila simulans TaxID=7240 RepID=B4R3D9_DROSI|nr:GD17513 [Drosophila simulans]
MRDYPSVPNVFRVASTHSINSENPYNNIRPANVICNTTERPPLAIHQLTTSASIEHSHPSQQPQHQQQQLLHHPQQQHHQQHSPYATLPRGQRLAPQQHQQAGLINTISGSIPATGFSSLAGSFSDLQLNNIVIFDGPPGPGLPIPPAWSRSLDCGILRLAESPSVLSLRLCWRTRCAAADAAAAAVARSCLSCSSRSRFAASCFRSRSQGMPMPPTSRCFARNDTVVVLAGTWRTFMPSWRNWRFGWDRESQDSTSDRRLHAPRLSN